MKLKNSRINLRTYLGLKNHSTEQCLLVMLEMWKKILDKKGIAGMILTDLSKAFDCLNHGLLVAKLDAYGFSQDALEFIYSYLKERKQRTRVGSEASDWLKMKYGVPQGSILGPLLFSIFLNDIFFFIKDIKIASYADDTTPYFTGNNLTELLTILENESNILMEWFRFNEMKPNEDKSHLFMVPSCYTSVKLSNETLHNEPSVELLGIHIDEELKFNTHVSKLYKMGCQKFHALARISRYISKDKLRILMKTFIISQFNYCPLIWMFHSRTLNNKINKLHERALRLVYNDKDLTFQELLDLDGSVTIHQRNLQKLAIEMFKIKNNLAPLPVKDIFNEDLSKYDLRNKRTWESSYSRTVRYGTETIRFRGPKTWDILPEYIKISTTLPEFKSKIKKWKPLNCTCRLCKTFIPNTGFID